MPSMIDQNTKDIPRMTSSVEVFTTFKASEETKESDEESLHLQLEEDEETEARIEVNKAAVETEEDILNKFDPEYNKRNGTAETNQNTDNRVNGEEKCDEDEIREDNKKRKQKTLANEEMMEIEDNNKEKTDNNSEEIESTATAITVKEVNSPNMNEEKVADKEQETIDGKTIGKNDDKDDKCENDTEEDLLDISKIRDAEEDNADNADNASNEECDEDLNDKIDNDEINSEQTNNKSDEVEIEETSLENSCNEDDKNKELNEETDDKNKDNNEKNNENIENNIQDSEMKDLSTTNNENRNSSKRSLDSSDGGNLIKRQCLEEKLQVVKDKLNDKSSDNNNKECQRSVVLQSIDYFKDFMKKKDYKITVYDLEELCLQKTSEVIQYCSKLGDARHQLQIQEQLVESLRKDLQQVMKQGRDLEIVNRKLMGDLKQYMATLSTTQAATTTETTTTTPTTSSSSNKPLQPLKITRSVGLQVRFTPAYEAATAAVKRRQSLVLTHQKVPVISLTNNKNQKSGNTVTPTRQQAVIKQTATTNHSAPILTQALTSNRRTVLNNKSSLPVQGITTRSRNSTGATTAAAATTTTAITATTTTTTATTTSIIDLTDEDDKQNKRPSIVTSTTIASTTATPPQNRNIVARNSLPLRQNNQIQSVRTVTSNIRITPSTTAKISNSSVTTPQTTKHSMYLVQSISPNMLTSPITFAAKAFVNLQGQNGVLNGSTVSVIQKPTTSIQLKPVHTLKASTTTVVNGTSNNNNNINNSNSGSNRQSPNQHPAPLPLPPQPPPNKDKHLKPIPPKPHLTIRKTEKGIILQWKMPYELDMYEVIASYQLFAYQETNATPDTDMWRRVGDVKALALPMACTLTQFADNNKYYFAVRPVDIHKRIGAFSDPEEISL